MFPNAQKSDICAIVKNAAPLEAICVVAYFHCGVLMDNSNSIYIISHNNSDACHQKANKSIYVLYSAQLTRMKQKQILYCESSCHQLLV